MCTCLKQRRSRGNRWCFDCWIPQASCLCHSRILHKHQGKYNINFSLFTMVTESNFLFYFLHLLVANIVFFFWRLQHLMIYCLLRESWAWTHEVSLLVFPFSFSQLYDMKMFIASSRLSILFCFYVCRRAFDSVSVWTIRLWFGLI